MEGKRRSDNAHQAAAEETPAMVETQSWRDRPVERFVEQLYRELDAKGLAKFAPPAI
jgi:hypothetical protein